ncbi:hypothetical protein NPIL_133421 [Nephila pilipes]|uniref:Uncharacterized protein n=1 Tax=Nephila pilipes TaxID=299642 RepID=A0A8X6MX89_NEPPI|nr:hypothetical protein NPIL_133421 [Nephila pilipes]
MAVLPSRRTQVHDLGGGYKEVNLQDHWWSGGNGSVSQISGGWAQERVPPPPFPSGQDHSRKEFSEERFRTGFPQRPREPVSPGGRPLPLGMVSRSSQKCSPGTPQGLLP